MHPAKSVIFFTTASGAGYGLICAFFLFDALGLVPYAPAITLATFGVAFALIVAGLVSSTFHLGHPERAWRAMSQWRTSWLSREGVMAIVTFAPTGLYALVRLVGGEELRPVGLGLGALGVLSCGVTVYCTAMIYASLKPVRAWANAWTPPAYLAVSAMSGAICFAAIAFAFGAAARPAAIAAMVATAAALAVKAGYWAHVRAGASDSTPESATGLGFLGRVRLLEAPHSQANYLMKEMVFEIARRHAETLRMIAVGFGFVAPLVCLAAAWAVGSGGMGTALALVAVALTAIGVFTERWLFFAEARHTVGLYYGQARV